MADYDFEKYYSDMTVKTEVNIDFSGVQIENPQGNPNEYVTNDVCYYISGITASNSESFDNSFSMPINGRLMITVTDPETGEVEKTFAGMYQPVSGIVDSGVATDWVPGKEKLTSVVLDPADDSITYTIIQDDIGKRGTYNIDARGTYKYIKVDVFPRYEMISNLRDQTLIGRLAFANNAATVDQNVIGETSTTNLPVTMKQIYGLLGLLQRRMVGSRWIHRYSTKTNTNCVLGYDNFKKAMNFISDCCAENNYGVDVKYYDWNMSEPLPDGVEDATREDYKKNLKKAMKKHRDYLDAVRAADITRTNIPRSCSFDKAYNTYLKKFLDNPKIKPLVDDLRPGFGGVTALIPPIKDAVKGFFYPAEDIENDFYDQFSTVYEGLKVPMQLLKPYIKSETRLRLDDIGNTYSSIPSDDRSLAFDMDAMLNMMFSNYQGTRDSSIVRARTCMGDTSKNFTVYPRVYQINGGVEIIDGVTQIASWGATPGIMDDDTFVKSVGGINFHYVNASSGDYSDTKNKYMYNKSYQEWTANDIVDFIVDAYNWILKKENLVLVRGDHIRAALKDGLSSVQDLTSDELRCVNFVTYVATWINLFKDKSREEVVALLANPLYKMKPTEDIGAWITRARTIIPGLSSKLDWNDIYKVLTWTTSSNTADGLVEWHSFKPSFDYEWGIDPESDRDIDGAIQFACTMVNAYKELRAAMSYKALSLGYVTLFRTWSALEDVEPDVDNLKATMDRIRWYHAFVNETPFTNKSWYLNMSDWVGGTITDDAESKWLSKVNFVSWVLPARFMVPVAMYHKVRKKYKRWGRTRHKTVKVYAGVRWAEVRFYDLNVFSEYPQIEETPGKIVPLGIGCEISNYTGGQWVIDFDNELPEEVVNAGAGELTLGDENSTTVSVTVIGPMQATVAEEPSVSGEQVAVQIKIPPEPTRNDSDDKSPVTIHAKAPALPYDEEVRKRAFIEYGPFSQNRGFEVVRYGDGGFPGVNDEDRFDGWKVFRPTSRKLEDLRDGIGLHDKVAFLVSILKHEFGPSRVELINTWRSMEDQAGICTGGPESSMLSWHNYGLAAKILIYQNDGITPIVDMSDDMKKLVKIARAFTDICYNGQVGEPCNVVWCGRIVINPSLFDWEFLPIGVGHKDAFKFREAIMDQKDPLLECGYVDVDTAGYAQPEPPDDGSPYVIKNSTTYKGAIQINGKHYVSPDNIRNLVTPSDIVLYDIVEYIDLIRLKMNANGTELGPRANIYEWKSLNDAACSQLIRYFALIGNIKAAKSLIAGDFVEKYQAIEDAYYSTSVVDYVKGMLGSHYEEACVTIDSSRDAGYITISDGRLHIQSTDLIPDNVPTMIDMHGQQKVDSEHVKRGVWRDGVFYTVDEIEIPYVVTDEPVVDGYVNGEPAYGGAMLLHQALATELHNAFVKIRDMFERYSGQLMYDKFRDGPNADKFNQLENEFGAIAAQDLMSFDDLETLISQSEVESKADIDSNLDTGDIYEKVVNTAQLAGMRKAVQTRERMHITDKGGGLTPGEIYRAAIEGRAPGANDLMGRKKL